MAEKKATGEEEEKISEVLQVVKELPKQEVRKAVTEDGTKINFVTTEEALTEILNRLINLDKKI